jgi:cytochrome c-type biogenesis protein CcmE
MSAENRFEVGLGAGTLPAERPRSAVNAKKLTMWAVAVTAAIVGLVSLSMSGSTTKTVPFAAVASTRDTVKVYGILDKGSVRSLRGANLVAFDLIEEKTNQRISVVYDNPVSGLPANFPAASHALATGTYDPVKKQFTSSSVLTKCPSKYKPEKVDLDTQNAIDRWQKDTGAKSVE